MMIAGMRLLCLRLKKKKKKFFFVVAVSFFVFSFLLFPFCVDGENTLVTLPLTVDSAIVGGPTDFYLVQLRIAIHFIANLTREICLSVYTVTLFESVPIFASSQVLYFFVFVPFLFVQLCVTKAWF